MKHRKNDKTKIIATVGPACETYEQLLSLVKAGVDVFRLNFSHANYETNHNTIESILRINKECDLHIGILADLQGPKLRVGEIENNALEIKPGDILTFTNEPCIGNMKSIYMQYPHFASDVKKGDQILIDDGKLIFEVISTDNESVVKLETKFGGILSSNKGVNLPDTDISLPCLTEKDLADFNFIIKYPVNWIALSFVRSPSDVEELRNLLKDNGHFAKIISKIEKPQAVTQIDAIIDASDAIMIARGDLGVEVPMERLPSIQNSIIAKCIHSSKPVIVATQLMESMISNPSPTRAEITDVANAVMDGTDALMLSGETSVGNHPTKVIETMSKIINESEKNINFKDLRTKELPQSRTFYSDVVCLHAVKTAENIDAKALIGMTNSGYTAFKLSSFRPTAPIYIFSDQKHMLATLNLVRGVTCFYYDTFESTDGSISDTVEILKQKGFVKNNDVIVNTGSMPLNKKYRTNFSKITIIE